MKPKNRYFNERAISGKSNRMGSISATILNEAKYQRVHKDRRKTYRRIASMESTQVQSKTQNTWSDT